jgi:hypothetical protein
MIEYNICILIIDYIVLYIYMRNNIYTIYHHKLLAISHLVVPAGMSRVWGGGLGAQCSRPRLRGV